MRSITPIQTHYAGFHFRSRLEARWAVFFQEMGIRFDYEPDGFRLGDRAYLPDFWLPDIGCWIEIKGIQPTEDEQGLVSRLAMETGKPAYLFFGSLQEQIGATEHPQGESAYSFIPGAATLPNGEMTVWSDHCQGWAQCTTCRVKGITYMGRTDYLVHTPGCSMADQKYTPGCVSGPFALAQYARFEHGEQPRTVRGPNP